MKTPILCLLAVWMTLVNLGAADVVVHEWGTFTSLQDENGNAIGGINTDDEPVPDFVHDVAKGLLLSPTEVPPVFFQGAPSCHPDVTMRLETPVLYFHAPDDFHGSFNVTVAFNGGWLTQFYPQATPVMPGIDQDHFGPLTRETTSVLNWPDLKINTDGAGPDTAEHVWLAPRAVKASTLQARDGETERFLFYRGVGHRDAPLRVVRSSDGKTFDLHPSGRPLTLGKLWLVDIRPDGAAACRTLKSLGLAPATFTAADYSADNVQRLRADLKTALVADGLFDDEADALLNTWELSYFKSAGLRLFFLVPQEWTDQVLPLTIHGVPTIQRVMAGRIELVTPRQRALLAKIAAGPVPDPWKDFRQKLEAQTLGTGKTAEWNALFAGQRTFASVGFALPGTYRDYLDLGRFRNALLLDEERRTGSATLRQFIKAFGLDGYHVPP